MNLKEFVETKMRMTAVYQPMVIIELLKTNKLKATMEDIGESISNLLDGDSSKAGYYAQKLSIYPKQVLFKHGVAYVGDTPETKKTFFLSDKEITLKERRAITKLCEKKIEDFLAKKRSK